MLKAHVQDEIWLIQQPHHALVSGYLAAHWGGRSGFARPGHHPGATDPARWRDEVVLGIAEHDNGWWETEALPRISGRDGLPVGVGEAASPTEANGPAPWRADGFDRWRRGVERLAGPHPYGALLVSLHAYWLYALAFEDLRPDDSDRYRHFLFGAPEVAAGPAGEAERTRAFLAEMVDVQAGLKTRLSRDPALAGAVEPAHLDAHVRLLQLLDSMSLLLALDDRRDHALGDIPRGGWHDRCTVTWSRRDARTIALDPYPFDDDALRVSMPVRVVPTGGTDPDEPPLVRLHRIPLRTIDFTFVGPD